MERKKKKNEKSADEIALSIEKVMAELEVVAEEDAELNRQGKPAINKLRKLSLLTDVLSKKQLHQEFLDHGVLTLLENWLEPLPDGSLPNINIRAAVLTILNDVWKFIFSDFNIKSYYFLECYSLILLLLQFSIDLEQDCRREQIKKSRIGRVVMFLSKSDEETTANKKLANELVEKWSRLIFPDKIVSFDGMKKFEDEGTSRNPSVKRAMIEDGMSSCDNYLILAKSSQGSTLGQSSSRALRPEAMSMDFVVRPRSKVDPEEVRARAKRTAQNQRHEKLNRKLEKMRAPKRKQMQATKISVDGRGMVKYL